MKKDYENINDFIDDIHNEINLRDLIIDLGIISDENDFYAGKLINCIFHDGDNTPSLQIGEHFFRCYACGVRGDVIKFIEEYYNIDFIQAVMKLADILNINIKSVKYHYNEKYQKLQNEWENYLEQMSNADKSIKELQRDYFPQEIGYDSHINYLVFPITSKTGAILGFTKRRVNDEEENITLNNGNVVKRPKWKHSSIENSLIGQCHNIFNLSVAAPEIKKKRNVIVTEGPKDVIAYRRISFDNTICVCGTSNSNNIWDMILPVDEIILSFDLDSAGILATIKTVEYLCTIFDIRKIKTVILPEGKDPYDVVTEKKNGQANLKNNLENRIEAIDFIGTYGSAEDVYNIYNNVPDFNKNYVLNKICKKKNFTIDQALSWMNFNNKKKNNDTNLLLKDKDEIYKNKLIEIVNGCENDYYKEIDENPIKAIEKARRILKLKYGIKM